METNRMAANYARIEGQLLHLGIRSRSQLMQTTDDNKRGYQGLQGIGPKSAKILNEARKWSCVTWMEHFALIECDWEPSSEGDNTLITKMEGE